MSPANTSFHRRRARRAEDRFRAAMPGAWYRFRVYSTMGFFLVAFAVIVGRLFYVHLWPAEYLADEAKAHEGRVAVHVTRGNLYDKNGVLLATDDRIPSLCGDPKVVKEPERVALLLDVALGLDEEETLARLSWRTQEGGPRPFVYLKSRITDVSSDEVKRIAALAGKGVFVIHEPMRYYPQGKLASSLLGFVNLVGDPCEGVELEFDKWLRGIPGEYRARKDAKSNLLNSLTLEFKPPQGGDHVFLTIDAVIQHALEQALDANIERCNAVRGAGIIMDAHTGAILALAHRPGYDPNHYEEFDKELWKNRALRDVFEPGSVFKIVVAAAALELGVVTPEKVVNCRGGSHNFYGHTVRDVHRMWEAPFREVFAESSNIGHIEVASWVGAGHLDEWIRRFGFGTRCTLDIRPFEEPGFVPRRERWSRLTMGSLPMGYEVMVTMQQLARAMAVIANGGYLIQPYLLDRVQSREGEVVHRGGGGARQCVLSPETAATMRELCHEVVLHGTGTMANIPEYRVGGKTGTAKKVQRGGFSSDKVTAVFAGFAPVGDPRLVGVQRHYGGYVCGPVFREVVREALIRLGVPPDPVQGTVDPNASMEEDMHVIRPRVLLAKEEAARTLFLEPFDDRELVARERDGTEWVTGLPDFTGMTKQQAYQRLRELGVSWTPQGVGRVIAQHPAPGTPVEEVDTCRLVFSNRPLDSEHDQSTAM